MSAEGATVAEVRITLPPEDLPKLESALKLGLEICAYTAAAAGTPGASRVWDLGDFYVIVARKA